MTTIFFSGVEKAETARILSLVSGAAAMISFRQYCPSLLETCRGYGLPYCMDSGAFAGELTIQQIEKYARIIIDNSDCLWFANADVIGNQSQSDKNYHFLLSLLPSELRHKVLYVYQMSAHLDSLQTALEGRTSVGIGGLVPMFKQDARAAETKLMRVATIIAGRGGIQPHYFGIGRRDILKRLNALHQGAFSTDSTTWLIGSKFNRLIRNDGVQVDASSFSFEKEEMLRQNARVMLSWVAEEEERKEEKYQMSLF